MVDGEDQAAREWYDRKCQLMEELLGREHDMVMHALFPYAIGGSLDLYYYPHGIVGTGIATKELTETPGNGPSNRQLETYELVMFTREKLDLDLVEDTSTLFGRAHRSIDSILNCIARYSAQAILNPKETCEFPADMEVVGGKCLVFDAYKIESDYREEGYRDAFGLLLIMEVHRSEMEYARTNGGASLIEKLKFAGVYPYSDLDRPAVA
jgi:hypothetical protein